MASEVRRSGMLPLLGGLKPSTAAFRLALRRAEDRIGLVGDGHVPGRSASREIEDGGRPSAPC